jgi:hypothetical protein
MERRRPNTPKDRSKTQRRVAVGRSRTASVAASTATVTKASEP